jgi:UDP-3-O-[3-hydroxymyristoyl] glucosamine N-acyltransferase
MKQRAASYSSKDVASRVGGALHGSSEVTVSGVSSTEHPIEKTLLFHRGSSVRALSTILKKSRELVVLVSSGEFQDSRDFATLLENAAENNSAVVQVSDAYTAFLNLLPLFFIPAGLPDGVAPTAVIHPSAVLGKGVRIADFCCIAAGVVIGDRSVLYPRVTLYEGVTIGKNVTLHAGVSIREESSVGDNCIIHNHTVVGADGFGYIPDPKHGLRKVPQVGRVIIEQNVEIGANSCLDRGAIGDTRIGAGVKIDNLVQIGHNVTIGRSSVVCGHSGIGGSVKIGDGVVIAGHVGVADHVTIASGVRIGGKSGVTSSLEKPGDYIGFPAIPAQEWRRMILSMRRTASRKNSVASGDE